MMEWISVNDKLPEPVPEGEGGNHEHDVLVIVDYANPEHESMPHITTGYLHENARNQENLIPIGDLEFDYDWTVWNWSYWWEPKVTHWMPLPDMPEQIENGA